MCKTEKDFLITIDTEGDYIWNRKTWSKNSIKNRITVRNGAYLEKFQRLCEKYGFKPTYLVDYEMTTSEPFVEMARDRLERGMLEIGMHMHGWTTPPYFELKRGTKSGGNHPYIGEYPKNIIDEKVHLITDKIIEVFGIRPQSHRSGRWYLDNKYISILRKYGYTSDCSVTPGVDWTNNVGLTDGSHGNDYSKYPVFAYEMDILRLNKKGKSGVMEVPVTTARKDDGRLVQLRPYRHNIEDLLWLLEKTKDNNCDYIEFMIHSSELMRAGSPNFLTDRDIDVLYDDMEKLFAEISIDYKGETISGYVNRKRRKKG
ncbi:MAG: hypothetical protein J6H31_12080 [Butyrivibrio sp.]|nr:hypothetical protein [Butyrivibrio sp.]